MKLKRENCTTLSLNLIFPIHIKIHIPNSLLMRSPEFNAAKLYVGRTSRRQEYAQIMRHRVGQEEKASLNFGIKKMRLKSFKCTPEDMSEG